MGNSFPLASRLTSQAPEQLSQGCGLLNATIFTKFIGRQMKIQNGL